MNYVLMLNFGEHNDLCFCYRLVQSALNNEFLTKACHEWKERLLRGDFTAESLQRAKADIEKDRSNVDPWKVSTKKIKFRAFIYLNINM